MTYADILQSYLLLLIMVVPPVMAYRFGFQRGMSRGIEEGKNIERLGYVYRKRFDASMRDLK